MKMRDGKVIDGTAFYDSISFNGLWSRVQPRSRARADVCGGRRLRDLGEQAEGVALAYRASADAMLPAESRAGRLDEWLHTTANSTPCSSTRNKRPCRAARVTRSLLRKLGGYGRAEHREQRRKLAVELNAHLCDRRVAKLEKHVLGWSTARYV
jgi:hypothetical protein